MGVHIISGPVWPDLGFLIPLQIQLKSIGYEEGELLIQLDFIFRTRLLGVDGRRGVGVGEGGMRERKRVFGCGRRRRRRKRPGGLS